MKFTFKSIITPMAMIVASAQGFLPSKETVVTTVGAGLATAGYALDKYVLPEKAAYATTVLGGLGLAAHMKYGTGHGNSVTVPALQYGTLPYLTYKAVNKVMPENWAYAKTAAGIFGAAEAAYVGFKRLNRPYTIDEVYAAAGPAMNTEKRAAVKGMYNTLSEADKKAYDNKYGGTARVALYADPKTSAELLKLAQDKLSGLEAQLKKATEENKDVVELNKQIEAAKVELAQAEYNNANVISKAWTNITNHPKKSIAAVAMATVGTGLLLADLYYNRNVEKGEWFGSLSNTYTAAIASAPFVWAWDKAKSGFTSVSEYCDFAGKKDALCDGLKTAKSYLPESVQNCIPEISVRFPVAENKAQYDKLLSLEGGVINSFIDND